MSPEPLGRRRRFWRLLPVLLVLALSALIQFTVVARTQVNVPLRGDSGEYFSYAFNLTHYGTYSMSRPWERPRGSEPTPDSFRPPGYPLFLSVLGIPEDTPSFLHRIVIVQAMLGVFSVLLVYRIGRCFLGPQAALLAMLVTAVSPHHAAISTYVLSESLFLFLLLAATLASIRSLRRPGTAAFALAGVLWGAASLVRSTTEFIPILFLAAAFCLPRLKSLRAGATVLAASFLLVLSPWVLRNQSARVSQPESSLLVKALAHGSYPGFMYEGRRETFGFPYRFDPQANAIAHDLPSVLRHIAGRFRAQPVRYASWYLIGKPGYFLAWGNVQGRDIFIHPVFSSPYSDDTVFGLMRFASLLAHWPLMLLGVTGTALVLLRRRWLRLQDDEHAAAALVATVAGYALVFHMIVAPFPRYGIPFWPLFYLLATLFLRRTPREAPVQADPSPEPA